MQATWLARQLAILFWKLCNKAVRPVRACVHCQRCPLRQLLHTRSIAQLLQKSAIGGAIWQYSHTGVFPGVLMRSARP
eukprot:4497350-Amphidinium_carterae.1